MSLSKNSINPLAQAVGNFNDNVVNVIDNLASLPNAVARNTVDGFHGEGTAEKAAGRFDSKPVSSFVNRLSRLGASAPER